jgi:hypothetical protein
MRIVVHLIKGAMHTAIDSEGVFNIIVDVVHRLIIDEIDDCQSVA